MKTNLDKYDIFEIIIGALFISYIIITIINV